MVAATLRAVTAAVLSSPRFRRRLAWVAGIGAAIVGVAVLSVVLPTRSATVATPAPVSTTAAQVTEQPRAVPPPRRELNALLDAFIPDVIAGKNLAAGWALVTPEARGSYRDWKRGVTPFQRFAARGTTFHGWRLNYSYPGDVGFDVFVAPVRASMISMAFRGEAKKVGGRWRIAVFYPQATFQPVGRTQRVWADTDLRPQAVSSAGTGARLSAAWLLAPVGVLGGLGLGVLAFVAVRMLRRRSRIRQVERELAA
jgi:hypothetical protein